MFYQPICGDQQQSTFQLLLGINDPLPADWQETTHRETFLLLFSLSSSEEKLSTFKTVNKYFKNIMGLHLDEPLCFNVPCKFDNHLIGGHSVHSSLILPQSLCDFMNISALPAYMGNLEDYCYDLSGFVPVPPKLLPTVTMLKVLPRRRHLAYEISSHTNEPLKGHAVIGA